MRPLGLTEYHIAPLSVEALAEGGGYYPAWLPSLMEMNQYSPMDAQDEEYLAREGRN